MSTYTPTATDQASYTEADDGDDRDAASNNVFLEALADKAEWIQVGDTSFDGSKDFQGPVLFYDQVQVVETVPSSSTALVNRITGASFAKAWGMFTLDGASGIALDDGINVTSVAIVGGAYILVTIAGDMASVNYAVLLTSETNGAETQGLTAVVGYRAVGTFRIYLHGPTGTPINPNGETNSISFVVFGRQ